MSFITNTIKNVELYLAQEQREKWDAESRAFAAEGWTAAERAEMNQIIDEERAREWDEHLSKWCQVHDQELTMGKCAACVSEAEDERRNDA